MRLEEYPPQEPLSSRGVLYSKDLWARSEGITYEEAQYGKDPYQRFAIVSPRECSKGTVLVFWHGGGWTGGYKEWNLFMTPIFRDAGCIFVSPGYRLAPGTLFPDSLEDCIRALGWVYHNITRYGGNPSRVFVGGHSAGGHFASLLAVSKRWRETSKVPPDFIRGCLCVSGVYLFGPGSGLSARPRFLGPKDSEIDAAASPIRQFEDPIPPFFVAYGEHDFPHLIAQAKEMIDALRTAGSRVEEMMLLGKTHHEAHVAAGDPDGPWARMALKFLSEN